MVYDWLQANISIYSKIFASIRRQCQYSESPQPNFFHQVFWWKGGVQSTQADHEMPPVWQLQETVKYYFADQIFSEKEVAHLPPIRGPFDGFPYTSLKYEIILMYIAEYFTLPSFPWYLLLFHEHWYEFWTILLYSTNGPSCVPQARKHSMYWVQDS